ncbi:MAG: hypothetical protein WCJ33_07140, partial [Pseudomonadota bacterium]
MSVFLNSLFFLLLSCLFSGVFAQEAPHELISKTPIPKEIINQESNIPENLTEEVIGYEEAPSPSISVSQIDKPSIENFGIITENNGGFDNQIWKGSSRENIDFLLNLLN